jgi:hypothetical protein
MKNGKDQNLELTENKGIIASTSDKSAHGLKSVYRHHRRKLERFEKEETGPILYDIGPSYLTQEVNSVEKCTIWPRLKVSAACMDGLTVLD